MSSKKIVDVPKVRLTKSGVADRFHAHSLRELRGNPVWKDAYRVATCYTKHSNELISHGYGITLMGEDALPRRAIFYGVCKALIAQEFTVHVCEPDELVQASLSKDNSNDFYDRGLRCDVLALTEMNIPEDIVNKMHKSILYRLLRERFRNGRATIAATSCPAVSEEYSIEEILPGVGKLLRDNTFLIDLDSVHECDEHGITPESLKLK